MKRNLFGVTLLFCSVTFAFSCKENEENWGSGGTTTPQEKPEKPMDDSSKVALAYVTSWSSIVPDPTYLTHINYAFGHVNGTFNGIKIDNEARLQSIVDLKKKKSSLNVILSIGGWGSGGFSEMAMTDSNRKSFAADCKRVIDTFDLDGIDLDWEHPTSSEAGISSSPKDTENFNLLMKEIRNAIGDNKFLTFASTADANYYELKGLASIVNFVNIMMYDTGRPPYHHSALHRSNKVRNISADESIRKHIEGGMSAGKLVLGIPFYGKTKDSEVAYKDIAKLVEKGNIEKWDDIAKAPYLENAAGETTLVYDNANSIGFKCEYLLKQGLRGAMYWEYSQDDAEGTLRKAVWNGVMK